RIGIRPITGDMLLNMTIILLLMRLNYTDWLRLFGQIIVCEGHMVRISVWISSPTGLKRFFAKVWIQRSIATADSMTMGAVKTQDYTAICKTATSRKYILLGSRRISACILPLWMHWNWAIAQA